TTQRLHQPGANGRAETGLALYVAAIPAGTGPLQRLVTILAATLRLVTRGLAGDGEPGSTVTPRHHISARKEYRQSMARHFCWSPFGHRRATPGNGVALLPPGRPILLER